jgi:hypothetical protein
MLVSQSGRGIQKPPHFLFRLAARPARWRAAPFMRFLCAAAGVRY